MNTTKKYRAGYWTALATFVINTALLGAFYLTSYGEILFYGLWYAAAAIFLNLLCTIYILWSKGYRKNQRWKQIGTMLLNIPIAVFYILCAIHLLNTYRLTIENKSGKNVSDIELIGCENIKLGDLEKDQKKTVWIDIKTDCHVDIRYTINHKKYHKFVNSYITHLMGGQATYEIKRPEEAEIIAFGSVASNQTDTIVGDFEISYMLTDRRSYAPHIKRLPIGKNDIYLRLRHKEDWLFNDYISKNALSDYIDAEELRKCQIWSFDLHQSDSSSVTFLICLRIPDEEIVYNFDLTIDQTGKVNLVETCPEF